jgi:hypothetical protein
VRVAADGSVEISGKAQWGGQFAIDRRRRWSGASPAYRREDFLGGLAGTIETPQVTFSDPENVLERLEVEYVYASAMHALPDGGLLLHPLDLFTDKLGIPIAERRLLPLWFPFPLSIRAHVSFELPPGYTVALTGSVQRLAGPGTTFEALWREVDGKLEWRGRLTLDAVLIEPVDYPAARDFTRELRLLLRSGVVARPLAAATAEP